MWHAIGVHFRSSVESVCVDPFIVSGGGKVEFGAGGLVVAVGEGVALRGDEVSSVSVWWVRDSAAVRVAVRVAVRGRREEGQLNGETVAQEEGGL